MGGKWIKITVLLDWVKTYRSLLQDKILTCNHSLSNWNQSRASHFWAQKFHPIAHWFSQGWTKNVNNFALRWKFHFKLKLTFGRSPNQSDRFGLIPQNGSSLLTNITKAVSSSPFKLHVNSRNSLLWSALFFPFTACDLEVFTLLTVAKIKEKEETMFYKNLFRMLDKKNQGFIACDTLR